MILGEANIQTRWVNRRWGVLVSSLLMFMVVFNVTFAAMPSPSTLGAVIRVGTVALLWLGVRVFRRFVVEEPGTSLTLVALLIYVAVQWMLTGFADASQ
ncbi:MAG: hypothetical protein ABI119_01105, partial [Gemmatimonadaceae bacterium]